jgi:hypothetical protein
MAANKLYLIVTSFVIAALSGCSSTENETKSSNDFATSAIEAFYSIEVKENNQTTYLANFKHDGSSLELEGGDVISVAIGSESILLTESIGLGVASYRLDRTENALTSKTFFEFTRTSQEDADGSFVKVPDGFTLVSPTSSSSAYSLVDGKTFNITWNAQAGGTATDEEFTLRYDFDCRHDSGTPSISSSYVEKVEDDGSHQVNLGTILGAGDYDQCSRFNIIAIRSNSDGNLDSALKSGSVVGSQVRTIEGSLDGLQLP